MIWEIFATTGLISLILLGSGLFLRNSDSKFPFMAVGYTILFLIGLSVVTTGLESNTGSASIVKEGDDYTITPSHESLPWAPVGLGLPLLFIGSFGIVGELLDRKQDNPYYKGRRPA